MMRWVSVAVTVPIALLAGVSPAAAADLYVEAGASGGDGSAESPFGSIEEAASESATGDTIVLFDGDYGEVTFNAAGPLTLEAADGANVHLSSIVIDGEELTVRGLSLSGEAIGYLIQVKGTNNTVEDCNLSSASDTSEWTAQDWIDRASSGISAGGSGHTISRNVLLNLGYGISVGAEQTLVEWNLIENFSRDGLRGLGDYSTFQYNVIKNCYDVDDHHDDGFQSWSVGDDGVGTGEVTGITLRGNTFMSYEDPNQPHRGTLQGIGCFDGTFVDWTIENNVVITDHWHGISLLGARNCVIANNTVIDPNMDSPGPPWIKIDDHKDGTPPADCIARNNLSTDLANADSVLEEGNIVISMEELDDHFVDAGSFDLHLLESSSAVDAAVDSDVPALDRDGIARPQGSAADVGAYEWHDGSVEPEPGFDDPPMISSGGGSGSMDDGRGGDNAPSTSGSDTTGDDTTGDGSTGDNTTDEGATGDDSGCQCSQTRSKSWNHWGMWGALLVLGAIVRRQGRLGVLE